MNAGDAIQILSPGWMGSCGFDENNRLTVIKTDENSPVQAPSVEDVNAYIDENGDKFLARQSILDKLRYLDGEVMKASARALEDLSKGISIQSETLQDLFSQKEALRQQLVDI